jgi:hypothetical protein
VGRASAWTPWRMRRSTWSSWNVDRVKREAWRCRERSRSGCVRSGRAAVHAPSRDWLSRYEIHLGSHRGSSSYGLGSGPARVKTEVARGRPRGAGAPARPRGTAAPGPKFQVELRRKSRTQRTRSGPRAPRAAARTAARTEVSSRVKTEVADSTDEVRPPAPRAAAPAPARRRCRLRHCRAAPAPRATPTGLKRGQGRE